MLQHTYPHVNVEIIKSTNIGIVGVGESSTEHWSDFCDYLGIPKLDFINDLSGAYFQVQNPNASVSCGCGTSFSI